MKRWLVILLFTVSVILGQDKLDYFPDTLNISPFTAKMIEPKLGFSFQTGANELELNIGNSSDILHYQASENESLSIGADFFTFTLLRGETNFHFPVDAVDYLFGVNFGYRKIADEYETGMRLRISHISAHFVDGHFDGPNHRWKNNLNPRVYSREFVEFIPYLKFMNTRVYAGVTYIFSVDPDYIGKDNYHFGLEYFSQNIISKQIRLFFAYDFKLIHLSKYTGNNSLQAGLRFGKILGKGFSIYYQLYSGKSMHGEYFDFSKNYSALGFNLEL